MNDDDDRNSNPLRTAACVCFVLACGVALVIAAVLAAAAYVRPLLFHPFVRLIAFAVFVVASRAMAVPPGPNYLAVEEAVARMDLATFPEADRKYYVYFSTYPHVDRPDKLEATELVRALNLVIASNSSQLILQRCIPQPVLFQSVTDEMPFLNLMAVGLRRIDIRELHWNYEDVFRVLYTRNPYAPANGLMPLVVRMDWFVPEISDMQLSDSYDGLYFGFNNIPKTRDEYVKAFSVINDPRYAVGAIEGRSGVSKQQVRRITKLPVPAGSYWFTEDSLHLDNDSDPLEHLLGTFRHDGEEHIAGIPKLWIGNKYQPGRWGELHRFSLFNGKGERVNRAPVDLVEDYLKTRDLAEIRTPLSCFRCHAEGYNPITLNLFETYVKGGANAYAKLNEVERIEAFHLGDMNRIMAPLNDDFCFMVTVACGCKPKEAAQAFGNVIAEYDRPLTLEMTAAELGTSVEAWKRAIAFNGTLTARLAGLVHGGQALPNGRFLPVGTIPRPAWQEVYLKGYYAVHGGQPLPDKTPKVEPPKPEAPKAEPAARPAPPKPQTNRPNNRRTSWRALPSQSLAV